jgi:hypothetical protein
MYISFADGAEHRNADSPVAVIIQTPVDNNVLGRRVHAVPLMMPLGWRDCRRSA